MRSGKWFALAVVILGALLLQACAPAVPQATPQVQIVEKEVVVTATPAPEPTPTPLPPGVTPITFWHAMSGWRIPVIEAMAADFNVQHPTIHVTAEYKGGYRDTLHAAIAAARAGKPPHVVQIFEVGTRLAMDSGIFAPAQEVIEQCGIQVNWDQYLDPVMSYYTIGGAVHSFPWNSSNPILYYNKTILDQAGIEVPEKPTYEDIAEIGRQLVDGGYAEFAITWPLHSWFVEQWFAEQGQELVNNQNGRTDRPTEIYLTSEAAKRIYNWWGQLYADKLWVNPGFEAWGEARRIFLSQKTAMLISSTSDVRFLTDAARENGFEVGTAYLPVPADVERQGVVIGGASLWIAKDVPEEERCAAAQFVLWMSATPQTIRWHQNTGYFPITKAAVEVLEQEGWFDQNPNFRTAFNQLLETKVSPATQGAVMGAFLEVRTIIGQAFEQVMADIDAGKSVEEAVDAALTAAKAKAEEAMAEYRKTVE